MQANKTKERYYLFQDEDGEYFVVMDYSKIHAIEAAKDWFNEEVKYCHEVDDEYAERYGLDVY